MRLIAIILLLALAQAQAATVTWDGGGATPFWNNPTNWVGDAAPAAADSIFMDGTVQLSNTVTGINSFASITFTNTAGAFIIDGGTITNGTGGILTKALDKTATMTFSNSFVLGGAQAWTANSNALVLIGPIALGANTLTVTGDTNTTLTAAVTGTGAITKTGAGLLTLAASNGFTGALNVQVGDCVLLDSDAMGQSTTETRVGTAASSTASLQLPGGIHAGGNHLLGIDGNGPGGLGALRGTAGSNTWGGAILFHSTSLIGVDDGTLVLTGRVYNAVISAGKVGAGTLVFSGNVFNNSFPGQWTNYAGTTVLNRSTNCMNPGTLVITNSTVRLAQNEQILNTTLLVIQSGGVFDMNGFSETIGNSFTLSGVSFATGPGTLYFASSPTIYGIPAAATITLAGNINLGASGNATFNISDGATADDFEVSGTMSGAAGLNKDKAGRMAITGSNAFSGVMTVIANTPGQLSLRHPLACGATNGGTVVQSSGGDAGSLEILGGITITDENLTIAGITACATNGAFNSVSGTNTWTGQVIHDQIYKIGVAADQLIMTGLWKDGVNGSKDGTKVGVGTLMLSSSNTFTGRMTVSAGAVRILNGWSLGSTNSNQETIISSGGALEFQGGITGSKEYLSVNGTGNSANGALRNISGTNSMNGLVTLQSNSSIGSDSDELTLGGLISGAFSLQKVGLSSVVLSVSNTYSAGTVVSQGKLTLGSIASLGTGHTLVTNSAILQAAAIRGTSTSTISNQFSTFQFTSSTPTVTTNALNCIVITNGFVSYLNVAAADIYNSQVSNIAFRGYNTFKLDSSTNAPAAPYSFSNGNGGYFQALNLTGIAPVWGTNVTIGAGGTILVTNTMSAKIIGVLTLAGGRGHIAGSKLTLTR